MESTLVWAGVWTSVGVGMVLLVPVILEFCKRNLPIFFGIITLIMTMYLVAPSSPEIRAVCMAFNQMPSEFISQINNCANALLHSLGH